MAASPKWKIYNAQGEYRGCTKSPEEAAALVFAIGEGATIRLEHRVLCWTEGVDQARGQTDQARRDDVAERIYLRLDEHYAHLGKTVSRFYRGDRNAQG